MFIYQHSTIEQVAADISTNHLLLTATFADNIAILASHRSSLVASQILQGELNSIFDRLKRWGIKVNE